MQRDKFFRDIENIHHPDETLVKTHCSYCGMQCGMNLRVNTKKNKIVGVEPRYDWPVTLGKMCPKGVTAYQQTNHEDRILRPLIRDDASLKGTKEDSVRRAGKRLTTRSPTISSICKRTMGKTAFPYSAVYR